VPQFEFGQRPQGLDVVPLGGATVAIPQISPSDRPVTTPPPGQGTGQRPNNGLSEAELQAAAQAAAIAAQQVLGQRERPALQQRMQDSDP